MMTKKHEIVNMHGVFLRGVLVCQDFVILQLLTIICLKYPNDIHRNKYSSGIIIFKCK